MIHKLEYYCQSENRPASGSKHYSDVNTGWEYAEKARDRGLRFRRSCWPRHLWCQWDEKKENYYFNDGREVPLNVGYDERDWHFVELVSMRDLQKRYYEPKLPRS